jgi:hypothetical protein
MCIRVYIRCSMSSVLLELVSRSIINHPLLSIEMIRIL